MASVGFRWLDILEKEFDKAFVDLDLNFSELESEEASLVFNVRQKLCTLSSCFAQLTHKAQTIFQNSAKREVPDTAAEWLEIARDLEEKWNLPNVIVALDGKHVVIKAPPNSGSAFYNYKDQHSIVLLAMADANYRFTYINVGVNGRITDGGVFWESDLSKALERNWQTCAIYDCW